MDAPYFSGWPLISWPDGEWVGVGGGVKWRKQAKAWLPRTDALAAAARGARGCEMAAGVLGSEWLR